MPRPWDEPERERAVEGEVSSGEGEVPSLPSLEDVAAGDPGACEQLMEALYPLVQRVVRGRLSLRVSEEDVVQEVFVKVFRKIGQYRREVPLERWVARIAVTTCLNAMRGRRWRLEWRRADLSAEEEAALDQTRAPLDQVDPGEAVAARELLGKLLEQLSPKDRLVIEMLDLEGRTSEEAAQLLGTSAVAVRVRATRARRKLKTFLSELFDKETRS